MQRLSIVRSLRLALITLTLVLAAVAAVGVASLIHARQRYESTLVQSAGLATAAANLQTASVAEQAVLRDATGPGAAAARRQATRTYLSAVAAAAARARSDPESVRLLRGQIRAHDARRFAAARTAANSLQARQHVRQAQARDRSQSRSRDAVVLVVIAGALALIGALFVITALVASMRRPLDALVGATRDLAAGQLDRRVAPAGPRELQQLGRSFNAMGEELAAAQRRIEAERRRLAVTIESLGDALIVTEPNSARIATVNPRASQLVPSLTLGSDVDAATSPLPPLEGALGGETLVESEGRALAVTAARLEPDDAGVVWTVRDMTERTRLEQAKSEFVAMASHELRSPLTSIKGFVELLERSPENMSDRQREFVDIILRSTDRLVDLVNDLLDVGQIEADRVELNRRPIDVGEAIREVTELMGPRIQEKHQQLGVYVAPTLPPALADPSRIRQIVANLVTNAHLYTPEGGRIHVGVEPDRAWLQIVVSDSGVGMTAEDTSRVFERFYRGSRGTRSSPGTGLGLSIVKSLVEMHHGQIEVESAPEQGTTFRVLLPAAVRGAESARSLEAIRGRRVLVVDDDPFIRKLIATTLQDVSRFDLHEAADGVEALSIARRERPALVFLDVDMPKLNGIDACRELRVSPDTGDPTIVMLTAAHGDSVARRAEEAGADLFLTKPFSPLDLLRLVDGMSRSSLP